MYGKTSDSHHFMKRAGSHGTKGSRRGFVDVETGVSPVSLQSSAQDRDSLKRRHAALGRQRELLKSSRSGSKADWEELGRQMQEIQNQLSELNRNKPKRKVEDFNEAFCLCARTMLPPLDYERVAEAARRKMLERGEEITNG